MDDIIVTTTTADHGGDEFIVYQNTAGPQATKQKRTRRPWVYKSDYEHLEGKYELMKVIALTGWILFAVAIVTVVVVVQLSEI